MFFPGTIAGAFPLPLYFCQKNPAALLPLLSLKLSYAKRRKSATAKKLMV
jgi:hypothetical protein